MITEKTKLTVGEDEVISLMYALGAAHRLIASALAGEQVKLSDLESYFLNWGDFIRATEWTGMTVAGALEAWDEQLPEVEWKPGEP